MLVRFILSLAFLVSFLQNAQAASCQATCKYTCEEVLFQESPNQFTNQKCKDYGGQDGGLEGGLSLCVKWTENTITTSGYGTMTYEAQQDAYASCKATDHSQCKQPWSATVSNYVCD